MIVLRANAEPVSFWHHVQWQQCVIKGTAVTVYVTDLHTQLPASGLNWLEVSENMIAIK
jgi:hypothetical protein